MGDYGAGPNHALPAGGTARFSGGLWVGTFLRQRTWLELEPASKAYASLLEDTERLARMEGLTAHAAAAAARRRNRIRN
jgi:phosphoribosyl-ATP pyrophosphohydrolase/phosphoribosyl-AMP cyclohydrolase/histidinol dehydrogenase